MNTPPPPDTATIAVDPHVKVTLRDIYGLLLVLQSDVAEVKGHDVQIVDHETRLRALEKWIWRASGIAAAAGALGGTAVTQFLNT